MNAPDFWNDQKRAQNIIKETNFLKNTDILKNSMEDNNEVVKKGE